MRLLRRLLHRFGVDVVRHRPIPLHLARRAALLRCLAPEVVLDVGANSGIYARELRRLGFRGRIVSFEPQETAFTLLSEHAANDPLHDAVRLALGDAACTAELNLAANSWSSSLLPMAEAHLRAAPESRFDGRETVEVETLDRVWDRFVRPGERVWLKIDTQGAEARVLRGAATVLPRVSTLELELSPVPLYEGETVFEEMYGWVSAAGFACVDLAPGLVDPRSQRLLSLDGIFHRIDPSDEGGTDG
jgi:FkbM family methyltransferase